MKSFWKDNTRVRVLTLVSRANDMEAEYLRWEAFLRHIRIQAFVEVLPLEASLRDMGVEVPRDLPPVRPPPVFGEDEGVESPIAMMGLSSRSPYFKLTPEQRLGVSARVEPSVVKKKLCTHTRSCPPPLVIDIDSWCDRAWSCTPSARRSFFSRCRPCQPQKTAISGICASCRF